MSFSYIQKIAHEQERLNLLIETICRLVFCRTFLLECNMTNVLGSKQFGSFRVKHVQLPSETIHICYMNVSTNIGLDIKIYDDDKMLFGFDVDMYNKNTNFKKIISVLNSGEFGNISMDDVHDIISYLVPTFGSFSYDETNNISLPYTEDMYFNDIIQGMDDENISLYIQDIYFSPPNTAVSIGSDCHKHMARLLSKLNTIERSCENVL